MRETLLQNKGNNESKRAAIPLANGLCLVWQNHTVVYVHAFEIDRYDAYEIYILTFNF